MRINSSDRPVPPSPIRAMVVCGECGDIVGPIDGGLVQTGSCASHRKTGETQRWDGYDFNRHVELCRCCGKIPLPSGSKWSVWFCDECKDAALALGRRHGRCIVPIGRHSFHAGLMLNGAQAADLVELHCFLESFNAITDVMALLKDWQGVVIRRNLEAMGLARDSIVPADKYVAGVEAVDRAERFREMWAYLQERALEAQKGEGGGA